MKVEEMLERLKPIWGVHAERVWKQYVLADAEAKRAIEAGLRMALARNLDQTFQDNQIFLEPPPASQLDGEYPLGKVLYGGKKVGRFCLREEVEFPRFR